MSSVQSAYAQVGPRGKYLLVTEAITTTEAFTVDTVVESVMTETAFGVATTGVTATITAGKLYTDMGKTVNVVSDDNGLVVQRYVKARLVSGVDSEGNDGSEESIYILSWSADAGTTIKFARTG